MSLTLFLKIVAVCLVYVLVSKLLNINLLDIFIQGRLSAEKIIKQSSSKFKSRNEKAFSSKTLEEKEKSKLYKLLSLTRQIIIDLGWNKYITPELLIVSVILISCLVSVVAGFVISNLFWRFILTLIAILWIFTILYIVSRSNSMKRHQAYMRAEDVICQNIGVSFYKTIEENIDAIDEAVRGSFKSFLFNFNDYKSITVAINILNMELGHQADDLCHKGLQYDIEGKAGMRDNFKNNIKKNEIARKHLLIEQEDYDEKMKYFLAACAMSLGFFIITLFFPAMRHFYKSFIGQGMIVGILAYLAFLCYKIQRIHSSIY